MSLRILIYLLTLALVCLPLSIPLWNAAGPWILLAGPGLVLLTLGYLALTKSGPPLSRWQLRYYLPACPPEREETDLDGKAPELSRDRLEDTLNYLVARSGHLVLEGCADGLFLELPEAFDRYVEAQLPRALPEVRLSRNNNSAKDSSAGKAFYLSVGSPSSQALRWATQEDGRKIRVHIHSGPYATLAARTDGSRPPGRWVRIPVPRLLTGLWHHLPVWDELSAGVQLSRLVPSTGDNAAYSSRSRLLGLKPPHDYQAVDTGRNLGRSMDGRLLTLDRAIPLFTVGAPASFLVGQIADDLEGGGLAIVVSPDRRFLDMARHEFGETTVVQRLDPQNSHAAARLGIVPAGEWAKHSTETVSLLTLTFLQDVGLDVDLPSIERFTQRLIRVLTGFSRQVGRDLAFTDLYAVSQSTQALRAFLLDLQQLKPGGDPTTGQYVQELLQQMSADEGYVQAVTILSALRTALTPLRSGPLHTLSQGPYFSVNGASAGKARLLMVPMTNVDYPEHDRLLSAMLDLTLTRTLTAEGEDLHVALHLHDPHLYRNDGGKRWIDVARQDSRLSLVLNVQDPTAYTSFGYAHHNGSGPRDAGTATPQDTPEVKRSRQISEKENKGELFFCCSESLASALIRDWNLPAASSELQELPVGIAIARLADMVVALQVNEQP